MTHPGLAVMLVVGVGLGAVLYYFFASTPEQGHQHGPNGRRQRPGARQPGNNNNNRTYWTSSSDPRNVRRRQDQKSCMVCLDDDTDKNDSVQLVPCMHIFHKHCIEEWRVNGVGEVRQCCPICRDKIEDLEAL